ncbi:MAG: alkaline phosphatase family protein [Balneolaceae bacterium]|nr:alkaline phosphatase family protein [Balneolaceae bacterium]
MANKFIYKTGIILLFVILTNFFSACNNSLPETHDEHYVVIISIDGFPANALWNIEAPIPFIRSLAKEGAWAEAMIPSNPTVTWPNHTSLVTGVHPEKHSLLMNAKIIRPEEGRIPVERDGRWDKVELVAVPTLYDIAYEAGLRTAEVNWPGTRNAPTLHDSFPDTPDNVTHITPELQSELIEMGILKDDTPSALWAHSPVGRDLVWTQTAQHLIETRQPNVLLLHLLNADGTHHRLGVNTNPGFTALGLADAHVKMVVESLKNAEIYEQTTLFLVSDHGFINTPQTLFPNVVLRNEGLLESSNGDFVSGRAQVQTIGGSAMVYLDDPADDDLRNQVADIFLNQEGIDRVIQPDEYAEYGLPHPDNNEQIGDLFLVAEYGYGLNGSMNPDEVILDSAEHGLTKGHHGFFNYFEEMETLFVAYGRGITPGSELIKIDNRSVAPTAAHILGLTLDTADGSLLEEILD